MGLLLVVRHGQASFGADDYDVLSETGWEQGRALGRWLTGQGVTPSVLRHGSMRRQRETAEAIRDGAGWDGLAPSLDEGWDEFDHLAVVAAHPDRPDPAAELDRREFQRAFEAATARWTAGEHEAEYAESFAGFLGRVGGSLDRAVAAAGAGETVVVVTSGGPIAAVCAGLTGPSAEAGSAALGALWNRFNTVVVNSSVTRVLVGAGGPRLLTFNEHTHLDRGLVTYR